MVKVNERHISNVLKSYLGDVHERYKKGGVDMLGRPTGFHKIDQITGGMQENELWVIGSRQGMGKTAFVLGLSAQMIQSDKETVFFSLEMSGEDMVNRMLASMTAIPAGAIKRGKLEKEEWDRVAKAASELRSYNMHLIDETVSSLDIIETVCAKQSVGLTVVDYAGILADVGDNTVERMGTISRNMKALSMPNYSNAPVALVTQLNRASEANEDSRPLLSNIKDSDAFGADATVVLFPFRPYYFKLMKGEPQKDVEEAEIIIAKNRNGPVLTTKAKFYPATMKWEQKMS